MSRLARVAKSHHSLAWSPHLLDPEIRRLVRRPVMVISFARTGATPRDAVKKLSSIPTGAPTWTRSPFGPALHFNNSTISAPTDSLTFSGVYPSQSSTQVPLSIAVIWCADDLLNSYIPFLLSSGGHGVWLHGGQNGGAGSDFGVVHGSVFAYPGIGTMVAGHWFLQMYSFDQVNMTHAVLDLNTGQYWSQVIAETRALSGTGQIPVVGLKGSYEALYGSVAALAWVNGAWTSDDMVTIANNPLGIWRPALRRRRLGLSAGFTTYTWSPTGGLQSSRSALVDLIKTPQPSGSLASSGSAAKSLIKTPHPSGQLQTSGAGTIAATKTPHPSGGLQSSGAAVIDRVLVVVASGQLQSSGASPASLLRRFAAAGTLASAGSATFDIHYTPHPSGGLQSSGQAPTTFKGVYVFVASGGLQSGPGAAFNRRWALDASGRLQSSGAALASRRFSILANGQLQSSGTASLAYQLAYLTSGRLQSSGSALVQLVAERLAAYTGVVVIFPALGATPSLVAQINEGAALVTELSGSITLLPE